jgi:hypothetical protein
MNNKLQELPAGWEHAALHKLVLAAIETLGEHFKPPTRIEGINVADLARLGGALASTIEDQTVATLNAMRSLWDPANKYAAYSFVRQPQMFPSVRLCRAPGSDDIIMGIDLSGWYVLAKEGAPTFRFLRTAEACAPQDLVVVVPWALSEVTYGTPVAFAPYIASARRLAAARNDYWTHERRTEADTTIDSPVGVKPYPRKLDGIDDKPVVDGGQNFGRIARTGLMDDYIAETKQIILHDRTIVTWIKDVELLRAERGDITPAPGRVV